MGIYVVLSRKEVFVINFYFGTLDSKQIASLQIIFNSKIASLSKEVSFCDTIYQYVALNLNTVVR